MQNPCPLHREPDGSLRLTRQADVMRTLLDPESFSSFVSQKHVAIPNGMDPPEHTVFRALTDRYFSRGIVEAFEPECRDIVRELLPRCDPVAFPHRLAVRLLCAFLGWGNDMDAALSSWYFEHEDSLAAGDRDRLRANARELARLVGVQLDIRRTRGDGPGVDLTARLLHDRVEGRLLTDDEIVSILRNWTAGEVGTMAKSFQTVMGFLRDEPVWRDWLRQHPRRTDDFTDELLRLRAPLASNRRVTACPVTLSGEALPAGQKLLMDWAAANRDPAAFPEPETLDPARDAHNNLLYGAGIHVCPGAPLARMELRLLVEELLGADGE